MQKPLFYLLAALLPIAMGACGSSSDGEPRHIRVGYLPISTSLPVMLAEDRGLFEAAGLEVQLERYANSNLLLTALLAGEIQATAVCADEPILAAAAGKEEPGFRIYLQEILDAGRPFDAILVGSESGITSPKQLEGRTLACFPGSQLRIYSRLILQHLGVDVDQVEIVQLPPPNMIPSLAAGSVDALLALEPIRTLATEKGIARILVESPIVAAINGGDPMTAASFLISAGLVESAPGVASSFVRAVERATELIESDYAGASAVYTTFSPIPEDLAAKVVITRFAKAGSFDRDGIRKVVGLLTDAGALKGDVNIDQLFYERPRGD